MMTKEEKLNQLEVLMDSWYLYTKEEYDLLPEKKKEAEYKARILDMKKILGINTNLKNLPINYSDLWIVQKFNLNHFKYKTDGYLYNKNDLWNIDAFRQLLLIGTNIADCDGFGYSVLAMLYHVFGMSKRDIFRVACATETNEGHFVVWAKDVNGIVYQLENRIYQPRSLKFMIEKGYEYWHYSPMSVTYQWYNNAHKKARELASSAIGVNLKSDVAEFTMEKALRVDKSKTLLKEWFGVVSGSLVTITSSIKSSAPEVVSTLQANQSNLSQFLDAKWVGILMVSLSIVGIYLRTVTNKDVDTKKDYHG